MEIVFCFENCAGYSEEKFVYVWFEICPSYRSRKKGTEGKFFEAKAAGRGWEMFPEVPFVYWGNLRKPKIKVETFLSQSKLEN